MIVRAFALGSAVGLALALAASCGPVQRARCMPSNCNGCCDENGECRSGAEDEACGELGATCDVCDTATQVCADGACRGLATLPDGGSNNDHDGGAVNDCSPSTCANGCCDSTGHCNTSGTSANCGTGGGLCSQCTSGQMCLNGMCSAQCNGCLDAAGNCQTGNLETACGSNGNVCSSCFSGQACQNGQCVNTSCSASNCDGCCDGNTCITTPTDAQCGIGGQACMSCQGGATCQSGTCQGGNNSGDDGGIGFPDAGFDCIFSGQGCIDFSGTCHPGTTDDACGSGGGLCTPCITFLGESCVNGSCQ